MAEKLRSDNRWVKLAKQIPWQEIEGHYSSSLSGTGKGDPALSARVAFGSMIIKERLGLSDEETVEHTAVQNSLFFQFVI